MEVSQAVMATFLLAGGFAFYTRPRWMPKLMARVPGTTRRQREGVRLGGIEVATFEGQLAENNPNDLFQVITAARDGQWAKRSYLCAEMAASIPEGVFDSWLKLDPNQQLLQLLLGYRRVDEAGNTRGTGTASTVTADRTARMKVLAAEASEAFARASAIDQADPTPWIGRIAAERYIQAPDVKARSRAHFAEAIRRDPESAAAMRAILGILAPYWWGKNGEGLAEARALAAGAPLGSVRPMAIFRAHRDEWHHKRHWGQPEEAAAYFRSPAVIAELRAAYAASIGSPAYRPAFDAALLWNDAAFCFYLAGEKAAVRYELARIGDRYFDYWEQLPGVKGDRAGYETAEAWARG
jgi:hypothetical protein